MGYHVRAIAKGKLGEFSKIREEFEEMADAIEQSNPIMALLEASDLVGAVEAWASKYGITIEDVLSMKSATYRAFVDGTRKSREE